MPLFDDSIKQIRSYIRKKEKDRDVRQMHADTAPPWPAAGSRDIVLRRDTGLELGGPRAESFSLLMWTNDAGLVEDGRITRIGPDLTQSAHECMPLGKIVIICGANFDETNAYDRFVEMSLAAYEVSLKGYMMRTAYQDMHEWVRISSQALENGLGLHVAGRAILDACKRKNYVRAAELVTVTSANRDVNELRAVSKDAVQYINAMRKMAEEMTFDCNTCEYQSVCDGVSELKAMAALLEKRKQAAGEDNG